MSPSLPFEIYIHIFRYLSQRDLLNVLTVSRTIGHEACRTLYSSVSLRRPLCLSAFFSIVVQKPHLAAFVQKLTFDDTFDRTHRTSTISGGLRALVNLRELNLRLEQTWAWRPNNSEFAWILLGHPFRLKVFRNAMFDLFPTLPFLHEQPEIQVWMQGNPSSCRWESVINIDGALNFLPHLKDITCDLRILRDIQANPPRPLRRITSNVLLDDATLVNELGTYADTLIELYIYLATDIAGLELVAFIRQLGDAGLRKLARLDIIEASVGLANPWNHYTVNPRSVHLPSEAESVSQMSSALSTLPALTILTLSPVLSTRLSSLFWQTISDDGRVRAAKQFMKACPSLKKVGISSERQWSRTGVMSCAETKWYNREG